jgi:Tfp pilus assembly protein PilF
MPDSYIGAANILMQKKDMAKAKEYVEKAIEISPDNSKAYTMQGMIAANEEQPQKALDSFNKAIEKDPEDAGAYLYRGVTQAREGDAEKALKDISVAKQLASAQNNAELMKEAQKYEDMINKARSQQGR